MNHTDQQIDDAIAREGAATEIAETVLNGKSLDCAGEFAAFTADPTDLRDHIDVYRLLAARKHAACGNFATAVRLLTEAINDAARDVGREYAESRLRFLAKDLQEDAIERAVAHAEYNEDR